MAQSTCPSPGCDGHSFELSELSVSGANFRLYAVQCATCGAVVSVLPYFDAGTIATGNRDLLVALTARVEQVLGELARNQRTLQEDIRRLHNDWLTSR